MLLLHNTVYYTIYSIAKNKLFQTKYRLIITIILDIYFSLLQIFFLYCFFQKRVNYRLGVNCIRYPISFFIFQLK